MTIVFSETVTYVESIFIAESTIEKQKNV